MASDKDRFELPEFDEPAYRPLLPRAQLQHGHYYVGRCRNACIARWNANQDYFYHWRQKFDRIYIQKIKHPVDELQFDVFGPLKELLQPKFDIPMRKNSKFSGNADDLFEYKQLVWCSCQGQRPCIIHLGQPENRP